MPVAYRVIKGTYADSVKLMRIRGDAVESFALDTAFIVMGTDANKDRIRDAGVYDPEALDTAGPGDLIMAVEGEDEAVLDEALAFMQDTLSSGGTAQGGTDTGEVRSKSIPRARDRLSGANMALISVPGEYAAREAWKALHAGLHVHIFSDNVAIEDERVLKAYGRDNDLLVMGPDCGSAIINGVPLGFANAVEEGSVGVVSAAGTGLQEVTSLLDRAGVGVSAAIGTGGRDLHNAVGGIAMKQGIEALEADERTEVIVLISKPPEEETMQALLDRIEACSKPVVVVFLGGSPEAIALSGATAARTLEEAAAKAVGELEDEDRDVDFTAGIGFDTLEDIEELLAGRDLEGRSYVRGLYTGGTLCSEAALLLQEDVSRIRTNIGLGDAVEDPLAPTGHAIVDLGADELTQGRPHPMLHPDLRDEQLRKQMQDDEVRVVLLDVVLGHGVFPDPAGSIAEVLDEVGTEEGPVVVASVCGTRGDPQGLEGQVQTLQDAGVHVARSNVAAVEAARRILVGGDRA